MFMPIFAIAVVCGKGMIMILWVSDEEHLKVATSYSVLSPLAG
jgi:hypothetical protein